jgi:hypothetical protein
VDHAGNPIKGVTIQVDRGNTSWGGETDGDGRYAVRVDGAGRYCMLALTDVGTLWFTRDGWTTKLSKAECPTVGGAPVVRDMSVPLGTLVTGRVVDKNGKPFPGLMVRSRFSEDRTSESGGGSGTTDSSGGFAFRTVPGHGYVFEAWSPTEKVAQSSSMMNIGASSVKGIVLKAGVSR